MNILNYHPSASHLISSLHAGGGPEHQSAPNLSPAPEAGEAGTERGASGVLGTESYPELNEGVLTNKGETTSGEVKGENHDLKDVTAVKSVHVYHRGDEGKDGEVEAGSLNDLTGTTSAKADGLAANANLQVNVDTKEMSPAQKMVPDASPPDGPGMFLRV